jgi:hypothetical protein
MITMDVFANGATAASIDTPCTGFERLVRVPEVTIMPDSSDHDSANKANIDES